MLTSRVVCCLHQSDRRIRLCISHRSDCHIRLCISHQSDCRIRVCISHQSYHSIQMSCTNHGVWVLFCYKLCHGIRVPCTENEVKQNIWAHLISVMAFARASSIEVELYQDMKGLYLTCCIIFFQLKSIFFRSFFSQRIRQTTNIPSRTMKTTSKVRSEHTQSLHYMHITPFFTCLNFIPPIKFHLSILDYALSRAISW